MNKYKIIENNITYNIIEYPSGDKAWHIDGFLHREGSPAIESENGNKYWYKNGKRHRDDGPATVYHSGRKLYYYNGKYLNNIHSNEELKRYIKLLSIS